VEEIRKREMNTEIYCLVGEDNAPTLPNWHRFNELEKMVRFIVLDRSGAHSSHSFPTVRRKIDISATDIRKRVASGRSIRYLVPPAVEEIISQENLYREQVK
jgi:nicotinate-nucleotide adenylyltransferase